MSHIMKKRVINTIKTLLMLLVTGSVTLVIAACYGAGIRQKDARLINPEHDVPNLPPRQKDAPDSRPNSGL